MTLDVTEIPRCFSISIQSLVANFPVFFALTVPASRIAPPNNNNFSVSVVFPASGWEIIANVRRDNTSSLKLLPISFSSLLTIKIFVHNFNLISQMKTLQYFFKAINIKNIMKESGNDETRYREYLTTAEVRDLNILKIDQQT